MGALALQCCCDNKRGDMAGVNKEPSAKTTATSLAAGAPPPGGSEFAEKLVEPVADARNNLKGHEYVVTVDRTNGGKLGIDCDRYDGATLLVDRVNPGLVEDWNNANTTSDYKVCAGDRIIAVNGIQSDARAIVEECRREKVLKMICVRPN
mmetsp:Transcript_59589/g.141789  ORF Transcript_59589/g.141789 Transcript_59589/m.141789 type:complete len:151 (+) Transcript_59589:87-539(+)